VTVVYAGVGTTASGSTSSCTITYSDYLVGYALNFTNQSANSTEYRTGQLSVLVNPSTGSVINATVSRDVNTLPGHTSSKWSGYTVGPCGSSCTIVEAFTGWTGFGVTRSSGNCGASVYWSGTCSAGFWDGITSTSNGNTGIAQSGFQASMLCYYYWLSLSYQCTHQYEPWVEFYPLPTLYNPFMSLSTTDYVFAYNFLHNGWLDSVVYDSTTGNMFFATLPNYMGSIGWAQFQGELAPAVTGGYYATPVFSFWFSPVLAPNDPFDLVSWSYGQNQALYNPSNMYYNSHACASTGTSCFEI
jgi:hypothetical protein